MRILVTGGAGFIGSHLCERLIADGHKVYSMDDYSGGTSENHIFGAVYVDKHTSQINDMKSVEKDFDVVFHLGEFARIVPSFSNFQQLWKSNSEGTLEVIRFCQINKIKLIYAASSTKFAPEGYNHSPYAFTKEANTRLIKAFDKWYGLNYAICYFYNVYGLRDDTGSRGAPTVVRNFMNQYSKGEELTVCGNGDHRRTFTHVSDIVDGLLKAWHYPENDEFYLGSSESYTILELANLFPDSKIKHIPARIGDRTNSTIDLADTKNKLKWEVKINLKEYLEYQLFMKPMSND